MVVDPISSTLLIVLIVIFLIIYKFVIKQWNFFDKIGIKYVRGLPILGTYYKILFGRSSVPEAFLELYQEYADEQVIGVYDLGGSPMFSINDVEILNKITTTDFDHFTNHRVTIDKSVDSILSRTLLVVKDQVWKNYRSITSPAFTGSKMKQMMGLINECTAELVEKINEDISNNQESFDMKYLFQRTVSNIIASTAFGFKVNALKDENEFFENSFSILNFDTIQGLKLLGVMSMPNLFRYFKITLLYQKHANYFRKMIRENMKYRDEHNIFRPDMVHLMMEAKKGSLQHDNTNDDIGFATIHESDYGKASTKHLKFVEDDLVAQCMIYIFAGFTTVPTAECFLAHELAVNVDIQDRLYDEIKMVKQQLAGKPLTYEILQNMKYLDMVVSEILRRWTVIPFTDRSVNKAYNIELKNGKTVNLKVGDALYIPVVGYHMNEKYFSNPEKFDPERFNDENKKNIIQGSFIPFGSGPRSCVGTRFALMEIKSITYNLLLNFKLEMCEKTVHPLKLKKNTVFVDADFWLKLVPRD